MDETQTHWQNVWTDKVPEEASWFEVEPAT